MKNSIIFFFVLLASATQTIAQQSFADSLYPKGTFGIEYRFNGSVSGGSGEFAGTASSLSNGIGLSYFFANRWQANLGGTYTRERATILQNGDYFGVDMSVRYHLRRFYFGAMLDYKNSPTMSGYKEYRPQITSAAYATAGVLMPLSKSKKFFKNTFFVTQIAIGSVIYAQKAEAQGARSGNLALTGHIGLQYLIRPRK